MLLSSYRRLFWRRYSRPVVGVLVFVFFLDIFRLLGAHGTFSKTLIANTIEHVEDLPRDAQDQKIYIAAQFWTSEDVLLDTWINSLLKLIQTLGPQNVYVSIIESRGLDNTAEVVRQLDQKLGELNIERTVVSDPATHEDVINKGPIDEHGQQRSGWIVTDDKTSPGQKELRRIPYLSEIRNQGLEPLLHMQRTTGRTFDKILYLNDVYFQPSDVLTLLATNEGRYDVACGLDFHYPPPLYDTFAVRDTEGCGPVMSTFPYFRSKETRQALLQGSPARVTSCWNGMLAVDAAPYYDRIDSGDAAQGGQAKQGLRFRGIPDSLATKKLEASECCLIHADLIASGQAHKGLFLNPAVRSGYTSRAYELTHWGGDRGFVSRWQYISGVWKNRFTRWKVDGVSTSAGKNMAEVHKRIRKWKNEGLEPGEERVEVGDYCMIMEVHILIWNGWKHVW